MHQPPPARTEDAADTPLSKRQRWIAYISGGLLGVALAVALIAIVVVAYV